VAHLIGGEAIAVGGPGSLSGGVVFQQFEDDVDNYYQHAASFFLAEKIAGGSDGGNGLVGRVVIAAGVRPQVREMGTHILNFANAPSMQERYLGWEKSYFMFLENPLFGMGPKAFGGARNQYQVPADFGQAHNMVLHVASEMGLLAFSFGLKLMPTLWGRIVPGQRLRS